MNDWIGVLFFVLLIAGIFVGLKLLSRPQKRTDQEFERRAAEGAGTLNAGMMALEKFLNPGAAKAAEVKLDLKGGRYNKKKREGKGNGTDLNEENND
jgi:hypothetical protein